jgi:hypothetical protein
MRGLALGGLGQGWARGAEEGGEVFDGDGYIIHGFQIIMFL